MKKHFPALRSVVCYFRNIKNKAEHRIKINKTFKQTLKLAIQSRKYTKTSASDNGYYPLICYLASQYDEVFNNFRSNYIYTRILEHVTEKLGGEYLDIIKELHLFNNNDWQEFAKNDLYGGTKKFTYDINGQKFNLSPTTIRYAKVLGDIMTLFDVNEIKSIAEIGIGYGGQCRIIRSKIPDAVYNLFDLPEVIGLAEKFLSHYDECRENIKYLDGGHIYLQDNYDLVISNYAFSELRREVQDMYLEKIILRSKRGYITWNKVLGSYSVNELLAKIPGSAIIDERPLTAPDNCIILWGNK